MSRDNIRRRWSADDDNHLRLRYGAQPTTEIADELKRGISAVYHRARQLGLSGSHSTHQEWTPADRQLLKSQYRATAIADLAVMLGRTESAVQAQARRMGLLLWTGRRPGSESLPHPGAEPRAAGLNVTMSRQQREKAARIGGGNASEGVRRALDAYKERKK